MKKILLIVCLAISLLSLSACADNDESNHVPMSQLSFKAEDNPDYIGSYYLTRTNELNASWEEWGEWNALDFSSRTVCFGAFSSDDYGVFSSRSDYHWIEEGGCLKLQKRQ